MTIYTVILLIAWVCSIMVAFVYAIKEKYSKTILALVIKIILMVMVIYHLGSISHSPMNQKDIASFQKGAKFQAILVKSTSHQKFLMLVVGINITKTYSEGQVKGYNIPVAVATFATALHEGNIYGYLDPTYALHKFTSKDHMFEVVDVPEEEVAKVFAEIAYTKSYFNVEAVHKYIETKYEQYAN